MPEIRLSLFVILGPTCFLACCKPGTGTIRRPLVRPDPGSRLTGAGQLASRALRRSGAEAGPGIEIEYIVVDYP